MKKNSKILLVFLPYLAQIIISIRGCVACNDLWPWPIFSRSFGLDLENRGRSVASTVLDGFFPYLVQMITSMRRCVACDDLWPWPISSRSFDLYSENRVRGGGYPRRWYRLIYLVLCCKDFTCTCFHYLLTLEILQWYITRYWKTVWQQKLGFFSDFRPTPCTHSSPPLWVSYEIFCTFFGEKLSRVLYIEPICFHELVLLWF